ncbi:MAG: tRNA (N(6)-L-threonylcarbamoyladenosine(37)-C(2))-methylthiotransferase MtaB [Anaerolineaceae bacterium]|nr:tRNA (N(6)-L-threonylcarbamoyladenosine(37)-C(2))-methylthiotransferase MtaB [Anaerolineaceae bacterium]
MNVYLDSIGCRLNQSEIERIARQFVTAGHGLVNSAEEADLVVINTCAVTAKAASDSRSKIRQAVRKNPAVKVISTGCWSDLEPERAAKMDNIVQVVLNAEKEQLAQDYLNLPIDYFNLHTPDYSVDMPGSHANVRAFIKVQDGCDNFCTFCVTRLARGKSRSLLMAEIINEINAVHQTGTAEVVLSGVNLGAWGRDLHQPSTLATLLQQILSETDIPRIRLSSLEPWDIGETFFTLWENPRLCRHFHLPLQSGSDAVLKRMARRITAEKFISLAKAAKQLIPDLALTTDVIVGFPGETDTDFQQTMTFVEQVGFSAGHIFSYSARPGTPAYRLQGLVEAQLKKDRSKKMRERFQQMGETFREQQIGKTFEVLWESSQQTGSGQWCLSGLTDTYLRVKIQHSENRVGKIDKIIITGYKKAILEGHTSKMK